MTIVVASTSAIQHDRMPSVRSPGAANTATPTPIVPTATTTRSPLATGPGSPGRPQREHQRGGVEQQHRHPSPLLQAERGSTNVDTSRTKTSSYRSAMAVLHRRILALRDRRCAHRRARQRDPRRHSRSRPPIAAMVGPAGRCPFDDPPASRSSAASRVSAASISDRWVNACGKLPICSPVRRDLLGVQADVVGVGQHLLEHQPGLLQPAGPGQRVHVGERAQGERALATRAARPATRPGRTGRRGCRSPARPPSRPA